MARKWESIICFEDRGAFMTTSRWRLSGVKTKEGALNSDDGVLWLAASKSGDTVSVALYRVASCAQHTIAEPCADRVCTGSANVSAIDNTGENAAEVTLAEANSSGLTGAFWIHNYEADGYCPMQVALCVDEDMDVYADAIESLPVYDATVGMAEVIRVATEEVIAHVTTRFKDELGGYGAGEAWFITDANRTYPDLRRIANPAQLKAAAAHRALAIGFGRSHKVSGDTLYSELRDYHNEQAGVAIASLVLATKAGSGDNAAESQSAAVVRQVRA